MCFGARHKPTKPWFVTFASFCGVNTLPQWPIISYLANINKLLTGISECKKKLKDKGVINTEFSVTVPTGQGWAGV